MNQIKQIKVTLRMVIFILSFIISSDLFATEDVANPPESQSQTTNVPANSGEKESTRNRLVDPQPNVEVPENQAKDPSQKKNVRLKAWLGVGFNYIKYTQTRENFETNLNFETFKWPSSYGDLSFLIWGPIGISLSYKNTPGSVSPSSGYTFSKKDYQWIIQTFETTYSPDSWKGKAFGQNFIFGLRVGGNQQSVPTIWRVKSKEFRFENTKLVMPSLGAQITFAIQKWRFETIIRYQLPQSTSSTEITSPFSFDGSVGFYRLFAKNYLTGFFWYGQWVDYKFRRREDYQNALVQGKQTMLYSNIDYRIGLTW